MCSGKRAMCVCLESPTVFKYFVFPLNFLPKLDTLNHKSLMTLGYNLADTDL